MSRPRNILVWTVIGTVLSFLLPALGLAICCLLLSDVRLIHVPLHSLMECSGGLVALAISFTLIVERQYRPVGQTQHYPILAAAFASMGILDLFHAAADPGDYFVLMRASASCAGGVLFGLAWASPLLAKWTQRAAFELSFSVAAIVFGVLFLIAPGAVPVMKLASGGFSMLAIGMNVLSGICFFIAGAYFVRRFLRDGLIEDWLFAVQAVLFGAAGCLFPFSVVWDGGWWWWHLMRLMAYVAALAYGVRTFRDAEREILLVNRQLAESNAALDGIVADRTAKLLASEERFELAVRGSTDGLWDWNVLTSEVYYSPRMKELLGYEDHEIQHLFSEFETRLHPDDHDWVLQAVRDHLEQCRPYDVQYRLRTKSGEFRWYRARGQAIWNKAGQAQRMAGSITDITEEHNLRERFCLAVEASPAALLMVSQSGRIQLANSMCLALFGYTEAELIGQPIEVLVPERFRNDHPALRAKYFQAPTRRAMKDALSLVAVRKDGSEFPVRVGLSPVQTADGQAVICGVLDVTETVAAMEAMRQAKEAAESSSRAKSSFLANMSHEIRTPMNGIIGMAQLLARTELQSHQRDYLNTVEESAHILLRLLNDILDFSKIEAGKLELESVDFRLSECLARASQMLMFRANEKGLELACRVAPEIPDHLRGDSGRLQQVVVNLVSNAVKFTEVGEIFLNVNVESLSTEHARLHFTVTDTGIGIASDKLDQIFHPFEQAEASTTRRFGGTGLGLTISRQLVEMMRGRMWVESEVGRGSTFHFIAEFDISENQHAHAPAELESLVDMPVLVIDDNFTNRRILSEILRHWHMQPIMADSAAAARAALQKAEQAQHPIRLVLLDHHMPGEDGLHFVDSARGMLVAQGSRVIMISSGAMPMDADLALKRGIHRFMTKPVIASDLLNEVLRQFGTTTAKDAEQRSESSSSNVMPRRVLLVEDNEINRRVAFGLLQSRGHRVVFAENGQEAVDHVTNGEFDVVLMDMQMPVMDGYEATTIIRQREQQSGGHIPIVAMTAEALRGDRERCLETGMDDYVSKPVIPAELYRAVERFPALCIASSGSNSQEETTVSASTGSNSPSTESPATPSASDSAAVTPATSSLASSQTSSSTEPAPAVDWNIARHHLGPEDATLREFATIVLNQSKTLMTDIRTALETGDAKLLRRGAHTLRGSGIYFGATALGDAATVFEDAGRADSTAISPESLTTLETELARFQTALEAGPNG